MTTNFSKQVKALTTASNALASSIADAVKEGQSVAVSDLGLPAALQFAITGAVFDMEPITPSIVLAAMETAGAASVFADGNKEEGPAESEENNDDDPELVYLVFTDEDAASKFLEKATKALVKGGYEEAEVADLVGVCPEGPTHVFVEENEWSLGCEAILAKLVKKAAKNDEPELEYEQLDLAAYVKSLEVEDAPAKEEKKPKKSAAKKPAAKKEEKAAEKKPAAGKVKSAKKKPAAKKVEEVADVNFETWVELFEHMKSFKANKGEVGNIKSCRAEIDADALEKGVADEVEYLPVILALQVLPEGFIEGELADFIATKPKNVAKFKAAMKKEL